MPKLAFVDIETTGLDPQRHEIVEVGLVVDDHNAAMPVRVRFALPVTLRNAEAEALRINRYFDRSGELHSSEVTERWAREFFLLYLTDAVFVGNNPQFDAGFLQQFLGFAPWHYHLIDVKALAAGRLGAVPPWSTNKLLRAFGIEPQGAHTALEDAEEARRLYYAALNMEVPHA